MTPITYEDRLNQDFDWALREGSMHFEDKSAVHQALRCITERLEDLGVPYAVAGGMALYFHGYRRFTEDVDILITREGLSTIHEALEGRGYLPPFSGSKNLRDTINGVRIEFLIAGDYPGDGKPKPVAFADPTTCAVEIAGMKFLTLREIIQLKLASGMTNAARLKDLGDVQELIATLSLPESVADDLDPFVRAKYRELWSAVKADT